MVIAVNYSCRLPTTTLAGYAAQVGDRPRRPRGDLDLRLMVQSRAHRYLEALPFADFGLLSVRLG